MLSLSCRIGVAAYPWDALGTTYFSVAPGVSYPWPQHGCVLTPAVSLGDRRHYSHRYLGMEILNTNNYFSQKKRESFIAALNDFQAGDGDGCIRVMRNPAPLGGEARMNWGHKSASGVSGISFLCDDRRLVSVGGTCVFVWRLVLLYAACNCCYRNVSFSRYVLLLCTFPATRTHRAKHGAARLVETLPAKHVRSTYCRKISPPLS